MSKFSLASLLEAFPGKKKTATHEPPGTAVAETEEKEVGIAAAENLHPAAEQQKALSVEALLAEGAELVQPTADAIESLVQHVEPGSDAAAALQQMLAETRAAATGTLRKISEQLGSNAGGWYEDSETGKRFYVKFYDDANQARTEYVVNAIYRRLGIHAARSELREMDGMLAVLAPEVPAARSMRQEELAANEDVRRGFVADAYLANWDVLGLVNDNIVRGQDGRAWRIDNGGSLTFRAQGAQKYFSMLNIPELKSMRSAMYNAGHVFGSISEDEIQQQAQHLLQTLSETDLREIVQSAGGDQMWRQQTLAALIGRRGYLAQRAGETAQQREKRGSARVAVALERLQERSERERDAPLRLREAVLADSDRIENQQIDIIDASDCGYLHVQCKLTEPWYQKVVARLRELRKSGGSCWYANFSYEISGRSTSLCRGLQFQRDDITICVPASVEGPEDVEVYEERGGETPRALLGVIDLRIRLAEKPPNGEKLGKRIEALLDALLEIQGALAPPEQRDEEAYKRKRYAWHHKLEAAPEAAAARLTRAEVAPGYFTFVETGKHREYEAEVAFALFHTVQSEVQQIVNIFKAGAVLATHERYRRGLFVDGMSSSKDLRTGGGDNVFTRILVENAPACCENCKNPSLSQVQLIFRHSVLDRTDWFSYLHDRYGSTAEDAFPNRTPPAALFQELQRTSYGENEQMFRSGISTKDVLAVVCWGESIRQDALIALREAGVMEVDGRPVEDVVVVAKKKLDLIDISHGRKPRSLKTQSDAWSAEERALWGEQEQSTESPPNESLTPVPF